MSVDVITSSRQKQSQNISDSLDDLLEMDAPTDVVATSTDVSKSEQSINGMDDLTTDTKASKRKRPTKKNVEPVPSTEDMSQMTNGRPKRTMSKRDEVLATNNAPLVNGNIKANKSKGRASAELTGDEDEQDRDRNLPIMYDVADVVWVKMGGHPWWPSLIVRDPNDPQQCFTKVTGNARAKRMFFVVFYGPTADFAWVSDAAVIPYQGVEAFTKYAQEIVDKAQTKSQKESLTERFQLKVTIGRREDWELAVREADEALGQTNEVRLQEIDPKVQFYTKKLVTPKGSGATKRQKISMNKAAEEQANTSVNTNESSHPLGAAVAQADRSLLAEKTFEFKSEDDDDNSSIEERPRKTASVKIKLKKQTSAGDPAAPASTKRRYVRKAALNTQKSTDSEKQPTTTVFGQTANGSSVSYQQRTSGDETPTTTRLVNGNSSGKKRQIPARVNEPLLSSGNDDSPPPEFHAVSPAVTTKFTPHRAKQSSNTKPQPMVGRSPTSKSTKNSVSSSLNNLLGGQHHRYDIRTGFLSPFEEQEVLDAIEQLGSTKTFEQAEQEATRRFEHILCLNLNRTHVDIPQEWFYTFLFAHPNLIVKNSHWFIENSTKSDGLTDNDLLHDVNSTPPSSSLAILKHQLVVLSKLYRNELQIRQTPASATLSKRRSTGGSASKAKSAAAAASKIELDNGVEQNEKDAVII